MFNYCKNDRKNKLKINKKRYSIFTKVLGKNTLLGKQT